MELFVETAVPALFASVSKIAAVDGIMTSPPALAALGQQALPNIERLAEMLDENQRMFVCSLGQSPDQIEKEIASLRDMSSKIIPVLPALAADMEALRACSGSSVAVGALSGSLQALLAAKSGAEYILFYFNRLEDEKSALQEIKTAKELIAQSGYPAKIIAAGFRNENQMVQALVCGASGLSLTPLQIQEVFSSSFTRKNQAGFVSAWQKGMERNTLFENKEDLE